MALLALSFSLLSDCTSSSVQMYEVAKLTFTHGGHIESFFGAFAVTDPRTEHNPDWNITNIRLKINVGNLKDPECKSSKSNGVCESPGPPGAYRVVCDEEGTDYSPQAIVDRCRGIMGLELLILCVSESRAEELLKGETLRVTSERLTVVLVNRSDGLSGEHACPLYSRVDTEINETTNVSVTVEYAGMGSITPTPAQPTVYPFFDQTTTFYFVMFAFCLLLLLALVWFAFNYLKRCHNVLSRRQARVCVVGGCGHVGVNRAIIYAGIHDKYRLSVVT